MSAKAKATGTGPLWILYQALRKAGAALCNDCRDYVYLKTHDCIGVPAVSQPWDLDVAHRIAPTPHHDPIDQEWKELEAEDANNQPQGAIA